MRTRRKVAVISLHVEVQVDMVNGSNMGGDSDGLARRSRS